MSIPLRRSPVRPSPVLLAVVATAIAGGTLAWISETRSIAAGIGVFVLVLAGWIVTVCLHEFGHAFTAYRAGDREVELRGYLTLNPLKYAHPLLSIVLPIAFIAIGGIGLPGGAVYLRSGMFEPKIQRRISLAGPAANAIAAVILLVVIRLFGMGEDHRAFWWGLSFLAFLQVMATILNLLPIPGLDGYAAIEPSLSYDNRRALANFKPYGILILIAFLFVPQVNKVFFDTIFWVFEWSGVPAFYAQFGNALMRFWS